MIYNSRALSAYKETKVKTASQESLIIMLYDESIKQIGFAIDLLNTEKVAAKNIEKINIHIVKAQEIITELMASLDMEAGGEIALNLFSIYSYFNRELLQANLKKKVQPLIDIKSMMEELRAAWYSVITENSLSTAARQNEGINVAG